MIKKNNFSEKKFDEVDKSILSFLKNDGRMKFLDIARKLKLAGGTIHSRMSKYNKTGLIKGFEAIYDIKLLGYDIVSFIGVSLTANTDYRDMVRQLKSIPEILEIHYTTGNYSLFVKVIAKNIDHFHSILYHQIQHLEGIDHTETIISLDVPLERRYPDPLFHD